MLVVQNVCTSVSEMIGIAGMVAGTVGCMAGQVMTLSAKNMTAGMGADEIQMALPDLEVCTYNLL